MSKTWIAPAENLRKYIDRIWTWQDERDLPVLLPGTGNEALFNIGDPILLETQRGETRLPASFILSMRTNRFTLKPAGRVSFICVRFKSGQLRHFCDVPMSELSDRFTSCDDLWGFRAASLRQRLGDTDDFAKQTALTELFLQEKFSGAKNNRTSDRWLDYSIDQLYYHFSRYTVEGLAGTAGISKRQMERQFADSVGVGPKAFQRNARFQSVLKTLMLKKDSAYLDTALEAGYYDQAHFIHEFKQFTGKSPAQFLVPDNFMSHFYNPSIRT